ncbi:MAG: SGNH/GDSL hydrolase family protein [Ktedonobacterales bacterium]
MRTILCFGDSNTWGLNPETDQRFERDTRWPGVLRRGLGPGYEVIEEGLRGRTTVFDDPLEPHRSGKEYLPPCLQSHEPVDVVILLLGTNDIQARYHVSALEVALGVGALVELIVNSAAGPGGGGPDVLLLAPPPIGEVPEPWTDSFIGAREKSLKLPEHYRNVAEEYQCTYVNTAQFVESSAVDGLHWEASAHETLGKALVGYVRELLE